MGRTKELREQYDEWNEEVLVPISFSQLDHIDSLLGLSGISMKEKESIRSNMKGFTEEDGYITIQYLVDNMPDPITSGRNYSQTDIINHIKKIVTINK